MRLGGLVVGLLGEPSREALASEELSRIDLILVFILSKSDYFFANGGEAEILVGNLDGMVMDLQSDLASLPDTFKGDVRHSVTVDLACFMTLAAISERILFRISIDGDLFKFKPF